MSVFNSLLLTVAQGCCGPAEVEPHGIAWRVLQFLTPICIWIGNGALWLWGVIKTFFIAVWDGIDAVLNPILWRVLAVLNPICTAIADAVYAVLSPLPAWLGITLISAVAGALLMVGFRYTSNQKAIGRARDDITGNLLALKLFKDELRVTFVAQWRLAKALARMQFHMLLPILIMLLPLLLLCAQMGVRYQWRPLHPDESALITVRLAPNQADVRQAALAPCDGVADAVGPVPGDGELVWRIRAGKPGRYRLQFDLGGTRVEKELVVGDGLQRVSATRPGRTWTSQVFNPVEKPLPADSPVQWIEIGYRGVHSWIYGENYWLLYFFVVSMVSALLLKPVLRVRF